MSQYFPKSYDGDINVKVDLSKDTTKNDLKNINLDYFRGKSYFDEDATQNYLVFQSMLKYFTISSSIWVTKWKSKGLSNEGLVVISASNNSLSPSINNYRDKVRLKFGGSILQQKTITYNHENVVNIYVVYEITRFKFNNNPILTNALFSAIKITENADIKNINILDMG